MLQRTLDLAIPSLLVAAGAVAAAIGAQKLSGFRMNVPGGWGTVMAIGAGAGLLAAPIRAYLQRPSELSTAVAIDQASGTKDILASTWQLGDSSVLTADPFGRAMASQLSAAISRVNIRQSFVVKVPATWWLPAAAWVGVLVMTFLPTRGAPAVVVPPPGGTQPTAVASEAQKKSAEALVKTVTSALSQKPELGAVSPELTKAAHSLEQALAKPNVEAAEVAKAAQKTADALKTALDKQQSENKKLTAQVNNSERFFKDLNARPDASNDAMKEVREAMANGNLQQASQKLGDMAKLMPSMSDEQKKETAKAAEKLAQDMAAAQQKTQASTAEKLQNSLQQQGLSSDQAKQLSQQIAQAAQALAQAQQSNNPAAQQQAQQQLSKAIQMAQQMANQGQGASLPQQQLLQQLAQQAAGQQLSAQQQQQLGQAMKQMAQAMQQQAQNGQPSPAQQQQAQQQVQQAMQQMQSMMEDAKQQQELNDAAQGNQDQNDNGNSPGDSQGGQPGDGALGQNGQPGGQQPNGQPGKQKGKGAGPMQQNNGGEGSGDRSEKMATPFAVKKEKSPSKNDEKGKLLASILIKDQMIKGVSKQDLTDAAESALREATDEVQSSRLPPSARSTVKEYFRSIADDTRNSKPTTPDAAQSAQSPQPATGQPQTPPKP